LYLTLKNGFLAKQQRIEVALIDFSCRDRHQLLYNNRSLPVIKQFEAQ
jgi:hypothetical protein